MSKIVKRSAMQNVGHQNEDRLSGLHDDLLHHIFSFLDSKEVVQTCLLAKNWTDFWSSSPFLNLTKKPEEHDVFVKFTKSLLFCRDGSNVNTLRIHCNVGIASYVNSWINYVLKRNVQVIDIHFYLTSVHNLSPKFFELASRLYNSVSLRVLKLKLTDYYYDELNLYNDVYLPCLEILSFEGITFNDNCFRHLISSCPRLQSLTMHKCLFYSKALLFISSPQLETLILSDFTSSSCVLEISAPCLTSFYISHLERSETNLSVRYISDFPYLRSADIYTEFRSLESYNKVLTAVSNTQSLGLSEDFLMEFANMLVDEHDPDNWIPCRFDNLKHITLRSRLEESEVLVIYQLLKVSPNIETFVLSNYCENLEDEALADITALSECKFNSLKQVKLENFLAFANEMNLVKFFIKNAENMKKLTLEPRDDCASDLCMEGLGEMTEILLASPRSGKLSIDKRGIAHKSAGFDIGFSSTYFELCMICDTSIRRLPTFLCGETVTQLEKRKDEDGKVRLPYPGVLGVKQTLLAVLHNEVRATLCYKMGIPLFNEGDYCPSCHKKVMDRFGDHAVACGFDIGYKFRHNLVRDTLFDVMGRAGIGVQKEAPLGFMSVDDNAGLRPADILAYGWERGKNVCIDVTGISPLVGFGKSGCKPSGALDLAVKKKHTKHSEVCEKNGYGFTAFGFTTFGGVGQEALELVRRVSKIFEDHSMRSGGSKFFWPRISFCIQRGVSAQLVSRLPINFL